MVRVHTTSLTVLYTHSTITVKIQLNKRKNYVNLELTEIPAEQPEKEKKGHEPLISPLSFLNTLGSHTFLTYHPLQIIFSPYIPFRELLLLIV